MNVNSQQMPTFTPHERRETWALIGLHALESGRPGWARLAFEYSKQDDPPDQWPEGEGPNAEDPEEPRRFAAFIGRWMIRYLSLREKISRRRNR